MIHRAVPIAILSFVLGGCAAADDEADESVAEHALSSTDPSYRYYGTRGGKNCGSSANEYAYKITWPSTGTGPWPLFVYLVGTGDNGMDSAPGNAVAAAMAQRGFAAVNVAYDTELSLAAKDVLANATCLFDRGAPTSFITKACATKGVDCSRGVVTWGHSLGGVVGALAGSYDTRVTGAFLTGVAEPSGSRPYAITMNLPPERLRFVNGKDDGFPAFANDVTALNEVTRLSCTNTNSCLAPDGHGWYLVTESQLANNPANHCWFFKDSSLGWCLGSIVLDPNWLNGTTPFALSTNANWLAATNALAPLPPTGTLSFQFKGLGAITAEDLTGQYPAGTVDWGSTATFAAMDNGTAQPHAFLKPFWNEGTATGTFTMWGPNGRTLKSLTAYNTASSAATVTVSVTPVGQTTPVVKTLSLGAGKEGTLAIDVAKAKTVRITSSKGARVQFRSIAVARTAASKL
jgi:pimeloyl-ACP methyl ester carboxylesterase